MAAERVKKVKKQIQASWQDALQNFLYWKQAQGLASRTLDDYRTHVTQFFTRYPQAYQEENLEKDIFEYMAQPVKPATFNIRLVYLKAFFSWCVDENIFSANPLGAFKRKKDQGRIVNIDPDIIKKLISLPDRSTFSGLRDYGLIILTMDTGIRPSEALSLLKTDINPKYNNILIRSEIAKARVSRTLPVSPITLNAIRDLVSARPDSWGENIPIFSSCEGKKMSAMSWQHRFVNYNKKLGVKIRPYDLRHEFALIYLLNGGNQFSLMQTMGHTTAEMTRRYVSMTDSNLQEIHQTASPLNSLITTHKRIRKIN